MNILLFAPGLLLLLLQANGIAGTAICLSICAGVQVGVEALWYDDSTMWYYWAALHSRSMQTERLTVS